MSPPVRDGNVPCAPLRHPIISHDLIFTTRNTKLAFHLRELQFAASAARFSFRSFVSFHPFSCYSISFGGAAVRLLSNLSPPSLDHIGFITFSRLRSSAIFADGDASASPFVLYRMKSAKVHNERANVRECRSRNHSIIALQNRCTEVPIATYDAHSRIASRAIRNGSRRGFAAETLTKRKAEIQIAPSRLDSC